MFNIPKVSAIVKAVNATLSLFAGGSFICPKTMTVLSKTFASFISSHKSFPSLVLSPTPAKTECPLCSMAIFLINSLTITVFPTPAPPKTAIFPPFVNGAIKSITLIPVSRICGFVSCSISAGACLWIGSIVTSLLFLSNFSPSMGSPRTLKILPKVLSPTGTLIDVKVLLTLIPLDSPSVGPIAKALISLSPIINAVSKTNF